MRRRMIPLPLAVVLSTVAAVAGEVRLTAGPRATRTGGKVKITFAVSGETDVEVAILDSEGKVVRHLAAGALAGEKPPPAPLKAGLNQSLEWDGKDDVGRPALSSSKGPFKVRVAAGLGVKPAGTAFGSESRPDYLAAVEGLAAAPDGRVYVLSRRWRRGWWTLSSIHVFRRVGAYEKTIKPYPATLGAERVGGLTRLRTEDGRPLPTIHRVISMSFYPREDFPQHMTVDPKGNLHFVTVPAACGKIAGPYRWLASLAPDGGLCYSEYAASVPTSKGSLGEVYLAASSDGRSVFATGMTVGRKNAAGRRPNAPAVCRIPLPARDKAEPFFGDPKQAGADDRHLNEPCGLAVDGRGRLLVADSGNNRVLILREKDGRLLGSFAVPSPGWVGAHPRTGAFYVASSGSVIKFSVDRAGRATEKARLELPQAEGPGRKRQVVRWSFALDGSADPAVLWVGRDRGEPALMLCREKPDGSFGDLEPAGCRPARHYWNLDAGLDGRTVSCKLGNHTLRILDEGSGETRDLRLDGSPGQTYRLGPGGQIYGIDHWRWGVRRWDKNGKPLPFAATRNHADPPGRGRLSNAPSGTTSWERDFDVDRKGNVYVKHRGPIYHGRMRVDKYDPTGKFLDTVLWVVSDGALGPRLDPAGNVYIAENVKPVGEPVPAFFKGKLPAMRIERGSVEKQYVWMYGSIVKFSPAGGAVWFPRGREKDAYAFDGRAKLPPGMPKVKVETGYGEKGRILAAELQGAEWFRYGCSYILDMHPGTSWRCHCTSTDFDVDAFSRCFYTDQGRFSVVVLDGAGNEITRFGSYGNQDSCGRDSYVLDIGGKFLRPRRKGDAPDLARPLAGPPIAFNLFTGLTVSDRFVYVADGGHRRVVRLEKTWAAEAACDVR